MERYKNPKELKRKQRTLIREAWVASTFIDKDRGGTVTYLELLRKNLERRHISIRVFREYMNYRNSQLTCEFPKTYIDLVVNAIYRRN